MSWFFPNAPRDNTPPPRAAHASASLKNDKIFVWGGDDGKGALYKDGYIYDIGKLFLLGS